MSSQKTVKECILMEKLRIQYLQIVNVNPKDKTEYYTLKWRTQASTKQGFNPLQEREAITHYVKTCEAEMKKRQPPPKPKEPVPVKKPVVKLPNPSKPQDLSDQQFKFEFKKGEQVHTVQSKLSQVCEEKFSKKICQLELNQESIQQLENFQDVRDQLLFGDNNNLLSLRLFKSCDEIELGSENGSKVCFINTSLQCKFITPYGSKLKIKKQIILFQMQFLKFQPPIQQQKLI